MNVNRRRVTVISLILLLLLISLYKGERCIIEAKIRIVSVKLDNLRSQRDSILEDILLATDSKYVNKAMFDYSEIVREICKLEEELSNLEYSLRPEEGRDELIKEMEEKIEGKLKGHLNAIIRNYPDIVPFNDERIALVLYEGTNGRRLYYNPETIFWMGQAAYLDYIETGEPFYREFFMRVLNWSVKHAVWRACMEDQDIHMPLRILPSPGWSQPIVDGNVSFRYLIPNMEAKLHVENISGGGKLFIEYSGGGGRLSLDYGYGEMSISVPKTPKGEVDVELSMFKPELKLEYRGERIRVDKVILQVGSKTLVLDVGGNSGPYISHEYGFLFPYSGVEPPWISAMAQGVLLEILSYAYNLTGLEIYYEMGLKLLPVFDIPSYMGGVREVDTNHEWWYAEYPGSKNYVLNGFLTSLRGLHIFYTVTCNLKSYELFIYGFNEAKRHLDEYDTGSWTLYDAKGNKATIGYHRYHIKLLEYLVEATGDKDVESILIRWKSYLTGG
ncbi:MAG: hypothetical protein DRN81_01520 [Thermoproteota archaeon]|nr:MAG: hypothetical protein DRN81_01520 [Candidatus Korarchaeota archaeon]